MKPFLLSLCVFSFFLLAVSGHAMVFDYVQNPTNTFLPSFDASSNARIDDHPTMKTGVLYMAVQYHTRDCMGTSVDASNNYGVSTVGFAKQTGCTNVTDYDISLSVDNPDYYLNNYVGLGDTDLFGTHISVTPYHYNTWMSTNVPTLENNEVCKAVLSHDFSKGFGSLGYGGFPSLNGRSGSCSPSRLFSSYEYYINQKSGVCSANVLTALKNKATYFSHPEAFNLPGVGVIDNTNCQSLMFPSGSFDIVDDLYKEQPEIFNSLTYDDKFNYPAYPITIQSAKYSCFDYQVRQIGVFDDRIGGNTAQYYQWSNIFTAQGRDFSINTPETTNNDPQVYYKDEVTHLSGGFSCPAGTRYYSVLVTLAKNPNYRHLSPVDYTYTFQDIFNIPSSSKLYTAVQSMARPTDNYLYYVLVGEINVSGPIAAVGNATDMPNNLKDVGTNVTTDSSSSKETNTGNTSAMIGGVTINAGSGGGTNSGNGGSSIGNGKDASAVGECTSDGHCTGLLAQAQGQNQAAVKANFIDKLVYLGSNILVAGIVAYSIFGLFAVLIIMLSILYLPKKMKDSVKELFNAGLGK